MKINQLIRLILLLAISVLQFLKAAENVEYWHSTLPDNWEVYYEIKQISGEYTGKFVSYLNGMQFAGDDMADIIITMDSISMITNVAANILYKGKFSEDKNLITGANYYPDGSTFAISMEKLDEPFPIPFYPRLNNSKINSPKYDKDFPTISMTDAGFSEDAAKN